MSDLLVAADRPSFYLIYLVLATPAIAGIAGLIYGRIMLKRLRKARRAKSTHAANKQQDVLVSKNEVLSAVNAINRADFPHAAE